MNVPDISNLTDSDLTSRFEALRKKESEVISDVVLHVSEIDKRGYFRNLGYSSLFSYLTQGIGYSEGAAQRRIQAARCLREYPEVYGGLREGRLSLCTVSEIAKVKTVEKAALLESAQGKSKREVERMVAAVLPPELPRKESIKVKQVIVAAPPPPLNAGSLAFCGTDSPPPAALPRIEERYTLTLEVDKEFMKLLNEAKSCGGGFKNAEVLKRALQTFVKKKAPKIGKLRENTATIRRGPVGPRSWQAGSCRVECPEGGSRATDSKGSETRYIPKAVRDRVFLRDGGRCTYTSKTGVRCSETTNLEFEHCKPFALGGSNDESNLCLLCRSHNQLRAEEAFGTAKMMWYRS